MRRGLNDALPSDIVVTACERTTPRFHARHSAVARWYLYQVARRKTAFAKPFVWWVKDDLDPERMRLAAERMAGRHDFRSFAHRSDEDGSTLVEIEAVRVEAIGDLVLVRVVGSHFLWRMVRRLIGVLVAVGTGALPPSVVDDLLRQDSSLPATLTAPASGLFLERVLYPGEAATDALRPIVRLG